MSNIGIEMDEVVSNTVLEEHNLSSDELGIQV